MMFQGVLSAWWGNGLQSFGRLHTVRLLLRDNVMLRVDSRGWGYRECKFPQNRNRFVRSKTCDRDGLDLFAIFILDSVKPHLLVFMSLWKDLNYKCRCLGRSLLLFAIIWGWQAFTIMRVCLHGDHHITHEHRPIFHFPWLLQITLLKSTRDPESGVIVLVVARMRYRATFSSHGRGAISSISMVSVPMELPLE